MEKNCIAKAGVIQKLGARKKLFSGKLARLK